MRVAICTIALAFSLSACLVDRSVGADPPEVRFALDVATKYMERGQVFNSNPVLQPALEIVAPAKNGGKITALVDGNMDLGNDTGSAWFPDGRAGRFSQFNATMFYEPELSALDLSIGATSYNPVNGTDFPFGERGSTTEIFVVASREVVFGLVPTLEIHYDIDEITGFYLNTGVSRAFDFNRLPKLSTTLAANLGYSDEDQSLWTYGLEESGLADFALESRFLYKLDNKTEIKLIVAYSTLVDSELNDWNELVNDIDSSNLYAVLGVAWRL